VYQYDSILYAMGISVFIVDTRTFAYRKTDKVDEANYDAWKWWDDLAIDFCISLSISFWAYIGSNSSDGAVIWYFYHKLAVKKYRKTEAAL